MKVLILFSVLGVDWSTRGYFVVNDPSGEFVSRHITLEQARVGVNYHAYQNVTLETYTIDLPYPENGANPPEPLRVIPVPANVKPELMEPELEDDDGRLMDPNTVYACSGGEFGGTVEPTGSDMASGLVDEDGYPQAVFSLTRLARIAEARADGVDYAMCEGGQWRGERLDVRKPGDIGDENRFKVAMYEAQQSALPVSERKTAHSDGRLWTSHYEHIPGFDRDQIDRVVIHGYKLLNGVPRPLQNPKSLCTIQGDHDCYDPQSLQYVASGWQPLTP